MTNSELCCNVIGDKRQFDIPRSRRT